MYTIVDNTAGDRVKHRTYESLIDILRHQGVAICRVKDSFQIKENQNVTTFFEADDMLIVLCDFKKNRKGNIRLTLLGYDDYMRSDQYELYGHESSGKSSDIEGIINNKLELNEELTVSFNETFEKLREDTDNANAACHHIRNYPIELTRCMLACLIVPSVLMVGCFIYLIFNATTHDPGILLLGVAVLCASMFALLSIPFTKMSKNIDKIKDYLQDEIKLRNKNNLRLIKENRANANKYEVDSKKIFRLNFGNTIKTLKDLKKTNDIPYLTLSEEVEVISPSDETHRFSESLN